MNMKVSKKRLKEIEDVYKSMGLTSEQLEHFNTLNILTKQTRREHPIVFIEAGTTSDSDGELSDAGLE